MLARFLGPARADEAFADYARGRGLDARQLGGRGADADLVNWAETLLGGAIGAASARVLVASTVEAEAPGMDEVTRPDPKPTRNSGAQAGSAQAGPWGSLRKGR